MRFWIDVYLRHIFMFLRIKLLNFNQVRCLDFFSVWGAVLAAMFSIIIGCHADGFFKQPRKIIGIVVAYRRRDLLYRLAGAVQ